MVAQTLYTQVISLGNEEINPLIHTQLTQ
jgi:hypothetical protein